MALSPDAERQLDALDARARAAGADPARADQAYAGAVPALRRLCAGGAGPEPDDVRRWALGRGWPAERARDLGELADAIRQALNARRRP